jgi:hypothetical protein
MIQICINTIVNQAIHAKKAEQQGTERGFGKTPIAAWTAARQVKCPRTFILNSGYLAVNSKFIN